MYRVTDASEILLVGEGDFSFTVSLQEKLPESVTITSSSLLSEERVEKTHKSAADNIRILKEKGVAVLFDTDATKLHCCENLSHKKFNRIIFNFPHIGGKSKINKNRQLLRDFFCSASKVLDDLGDICVTLCRGQGGTPADEPVRAWSDTWQVVSMAAYADLVMTGVMPFCAEDYPFYSSTGYRSRDQHFHTQSALTHIFQRSKPLLTPSLEALNPQLTEIDGSCYLVPSHLSTKLNRNLLDQAGHPLHLVKEHLEDMLRGSLNGTRHLCTSAPLSLVVGKPNNCKEDWNKRHQILLSPLEHAEKEKFISAADEEAIRISSSSSKCRPLSDPKCSYLRTTLLDSFEDFSNSDAFMSMSEDAVLCVCGKVFQRPSVTDFKSPVGHEMLFIFKGKDISSEECLRLTKDLLEKTLCLTERRHAQLSESTTALPPRYQQYLEPGTCSALEISYQSNNQHYTAACNQVGPTGKPNPVSSKQKIARLAKTIAHVGRLCSIPAVAAVISLDELCLILYDILDSRLLWSTDPRFCEQFQVLSPGGAHQFKPISFYPPLWRHDVSFWENDDGEDFNEEKLMRMIQDLGGDVISEVILMNVWTQPSTGRKSRCYRQVYQSCDQAVSHDKAHEFQNVLRTAVERELGVTLR